MNWQTKCVIDNAKGALPFQARLRRLKDRLSPYQPNSRRDRETMVQGIRQVEWLSKVLPIKGASVLEIGSGWQPIVPLLYSLAGASQIFLTDLNVLLRPDTLAAALSSLRTQRQLLLDGLKLDPKALDHSLREDPRTSMEDRLKEMRLVYMAPCDCRKLDLPAASLDVVTSRNCLEHIPPGVLQEILRESYRLLKPGGAACHLVDHSDHWEHNDKNLSRINFLKYSDSVFRWTYLLNSLNYQNRLRHPEYIEMLHNVGFRLVREDHSVDEPALRYLAQMRLAERFRKFSNEDLATIDSLLLAVKARV
jgi:SAM-dependent methyltransferase